MKHFAEISASAERCVDAAEALVQARGYNGFSYDDVASVVGIKKPSIHHHFPTKADLVGVVAQRYTHRFQEALLHIEGEHAGAFERLTAYVGLFDRAFATDRRLCVCGMLGAETETLPAVVLEQVQDFFRVNLGWLAATFAMGQRAGQLKAAAEPAAQAEALLCALEGAMVVGRSLPAGRGPGQVGHTVLSGLQA
jgi:TetR/AcrR family transcriptional repressor of nem operon